MAYAAYRPDVGYVQVIISRLGLIKISVIHLVMCFNKGNELYSGYVIASNR
jgi:hypothetical protein